MRTFLPVDVNDSMTAKGSRDARRVRKVRDNRDFLAESQQQKNIGNSRVRRRGNRKLRVYVTSIREASNSKNASNSMDNINSASNSRDTIISVSNNRDSNNSRTLPTIGSQTKVIKPGRYGTLGIAKVGRQQQLRANNGMQAAMQRLTKKLLTWRMKLKVGRQQQLRTNNGMQAAMQRFTKKLLTLRMKLKGKK
jgi:hypothetical protein